MNINHMLTGCRSRHVQLICIIVTCTVIYFSATIAPLSTIMTLMAVGFGLLHMLIKHGKQHLLAKYPNQQNILRVCSVTPIMLWGILIVALPQQATWGAFAAFLLQTIGFYMIGMFLVGLKQHRN